MKTIRTMIDFTLIVSGTVALLFICYTILDFVAYMATM
jgi:hypothetical protein